MNARFKYIEPWDSYIPLPGCDEPQDWELTPLETGPLEPALAPHCEFCATLREHAKSGTCWCWRCAVGAQCQADLRKAKALEF